MCCVCSLLIQLARDVQSDLHPHFGHLFVTLASLLHTQDATCIEVPKLCVHVCTCVYLPSYGDGNHVRFCLHHVASIHLPGLPAEVPLEASV